MNQWNQPVVVAFFLGIAILVFGIWRSKLELGDGLKDEDGRTSAGRICAVGAWLCSTFYLLSHDVTEFVFLGYTVVWALLMCGSKGLDVLSTVLGTLRKP